MIRHIENLINLVDQETGEIENSEPVKVKRFKKCFDTVESILRNLKQVISSYSFPDHNDEVKYFKHHQPAIYSRLFYYRVLFQIELSKPRLTTPENLKTFLTSEISHLQKIFETYKWLYDYYLIEANDRDIELFTRKNVKSDIFKDDCLLFTDTSYTTGYDIIIAKFIAHEKVINEIILQLCAKNPGENIQMLYTPVSGHNLNWTAPKIALIEFVYALQAAGFINNGSTDLKTLIHLFENIFKTDLNDFYRSFANLKTRKEFTKHLDFLRESLIKKIENDLK